MTSHSRDLGLPYQRLDDEETIVVDPRSREVHLLNETAARIWELLASARTIEDLTTALVEEYDGPIAEVRASVEETLKIFSDKGLLAGGGES